MRRLWLLICGLGLPVILAGQTAPVSVRGSAPLQLPAIDALDASVSVPANTTAVLAAEASLPVSAVFPLAVYDQKANSMATLKAAALMPETRTPMQLEAILAGYVGRWEGDVYMRVVGINKVVTFPIEMIYTMGQENGRMTLLCTTKYTYNGRAVVEHQRTWIQNGRLVSEASANGVTRRFIVYSRGESLVWVLDDPKRSPLDYYHMETVKLTAGGGRMFSIDFEARPSQRGTMLLCQMTDLKLVK